jgi:hypothetical protein
MTNKLKFSSLLVVAVALLSTSCKKSFLDVSPPTSVTPTVALGTVGDVKNALFGAYASLRNVNYMGRTAVMLGDIMADNAYQHTTNTNRYTTYNAYSYTVTDGDALGIWTACYATILRCNNIINCNLQPVTATLNQYKGEAYAIRALSYFTLVRYFARPYTDDPNGYGVPLVLSYNAYAQPGRAKVTEVYAQINSDLTNAFTLMTTYANSAQFSKYAARALQARVYLNMGDMTNAKTAAQDVIANGGFTLLSATGHTSFWANSSYRTDKLETIFEVSSDAISNLAFDALSYLYSQSGNYGDYVLTTGTNGIYPLFQTGDVRLVIYPLTPRPKPAGAAIPCVEKYPVISGDLSDTKVLRLSEMYLIAAEASLPADEASALTYVNTITANRGAAAITSTGAQLFEDVLTERRKELAFEGERYWDLQRLKRDVVRSTNYPAAARTILYSNYRRVLPIPQSELDANPTLKTQQNAGYQ